MSISLYKLQIAFKNIAQVVREDSWDSFHANTIVNSPMQHEYLYQKNSKRHKIYCELYKQLYSSVNWDKDYMFSKNADESFQYDLINLTDNICTMMGIKEWWYRELTPEDGYAELGPPPTIFTGSSNAISNTEFAKCFNLKKSIEKTEDN